MSNTFEIKRFWNYFKWDLRNAKDSYLLSLVITAAMPLFFFIFHNLLNIILKSDSIETFEVGKYFSFFTAYFVVILTFPVKAYGRVTEKRYGTEWVLTPASALEKTLSVILITCVVLPVLFFAMLGLWDFLLGTIFPGTYGDAAVLKLSSIWEDVSAVLEESFAGLESILTTALFTGWAGGILTYTLGSMFFKKGKIGKTILICMAFSMLLSTFLTVVGFTGLQAFALDPTNINDEQAANLFRAYFYISNGITLAALLAGLYFRIKTIKH